MSFLKTRMLYDDGAYYHWTAAPDNDGHDHPKADNAELNRTDGREVLHFINHLGSKYRPAPSLAVYRKIERMIRHDVPEEIRTHGEIANWIVSNWMKRTLP